MNRYNTVSTVGEISFDSPCHPGERVRIEIPDDDSPGYTATCSAGHEVTAEQDRREVHQRFRWAVVQSLEHAHPLGDDGGDLLPPESEQES